MKKIISMLLALVMLASMFAACGETTPAVTEGSAEATTTTEGKDELGIPLTADFGGEEFHILSAGNQAFNDFNFEEDTSLPLDSAQYKRKLKVEEDYKVKIVQDIQTGYSSGSSGKPGPGYTAVNKQVTSGSADYDLCLIAGYDVSQLASIGYLYDMNSIEGIDLSKSWWDENATNSLSIKDVVFFTTGDITVSDNCCAFCLMFNKKLLNEYDLDSPYELVEDGKWTIENFGILCKAVSEDLNQDGVYNENDRFGLLVWDDSIVGMVNAAGERCCTINDNGEIELTFYNETTLDALAQYTDIAYDTQYAFTYQRVLKTGNGMWQNDQALFFTALINNMPMYREMESDFGILPYPKLNETQDAHYTTVAPYNSQFVCVPYYTGDIERIGIVTEALAYYGQKIVTPALYEVTLVGQSARDSESEAMLDIIFENLVYDIGYFYQIGTYNKQLILKLRNFDSNFTSMYDSYESQAKTTLNTINKFFTEAVSEWQ